MTVYLLYLYPLYPIPNISALRKTMARCQKFGRIVDRMKEIAIFERKLPKAKSIVVIIMYYTRTRTAKKNYGLVSMEKCAVSRAEYGGESAAVAPSAFFRLGAAAHASPCIILV